MHEVILAAVVSGDPPIQVTQLDVQGMAALLGLFVPLSVALVTKKYAHPILKSTVNVLGSVAVAVIALWAQYNGHVTWWAVVNTVIVSLIASISAYAAFWKNVNLNGKLAPNAGLGTNNPPREGGKLL